MAGREGRLGVVFQGELRDLRCMLAVDFRDDAQAEIHTGGDTAARDANDVDRPVPAAVIRGLQAAWNRGARVTSI